MLIPCQEEQDVIIRFSLIQVIAFQLTLAPLVHRVTSTNVFRPSSQYHSLLLECLAIAGHEHTGRSETYIVPAVHE
jgi:hypothetical protein